MILTDFSRALMAEVARLGEGRIVRGVAEAARICEVTPRSIELWIYGKSKPNLPTRVGVLHLIEQARAKPTRRIEPVPSLPY